MFAYGLRQEEPDFKGDYVLECIWDSIAPQIDANYQRFLNGCKGGIFGRLGGAPKGNGNARRDKQPQNNPKTTANDNVTVNENNNVNVNEDVKNNDALNRFSKPNNEQEDSANGGWRYISSVRRNLLGFDNDRIAEYKKEMFRAEVEELAGKVGMPQDQKEAFISWWTEHSPGSDKIKADYEVTFDTENRMKIWADRHKPSPKQQAPKSRMDQLEEDLKYINNFFYGQQQQNSAPDEQ